MTNIIVSTGLKAQFDPHGYSGNAYGAGKNFKYAYALLCSDLGKKPHKINQRTSTHKLPNGMTRKQTEIYYEKGQWEGSITICSDF